MIEHRKSEFDEPYSYLKNNLLRSLEVEGFIDDFAKIHPETYLINILDNPLKNNGTIDVFRAYDDLLINLPVEEINLICVGQTGQKFFNLPDNNSLLSNLEKICSFFETMMTTYPSVVFFNPIDTVLKFISKDYLFEFQKDGLPISKHIPLYEIKTISDFEKLQTISIEKNLEFVVKPKIAERGNGSYILSDLNSNKVIEILKKHEIFNKNDSIYAGVLSRQGLFAQVFDEDFLTHGEKKIFFIDGEITLARRNVPEKDALKKYGNSLDFKKGLKEEIYVPTKEEIDFVYKIASHLKFKKIDFDYFRLDIIGDGTAGNIYVNELELFNPCSSAGHNVFNLKSGNPTYTKKVVENHNRRLLEAFKKALNRSTNQRFKIVIHKTGLTDIVKDSLCVKK